IVYGGSANVSGNVGIPNGAVRQGTPIDFAKARSDLQGLADGLSQAPTNGTTTFQYGALTLDGSNSVRNVFAVNGNDLSNAHTLRINVPAGSTALINIAGATVNFQNMGIFINNSNGNAPAGQQQVLFNFYQATGLNVSGIGVKGSILAPRAQVSFNNGHINGIFVAETMVNGYGEAHHYPFTGCLPIGPVQPTPTPTATPSPTVTPTATATATFTPTPTITL